MKRGTYINSRFTRWWLSYLCIGCFLLSRYVTAGKAAESALDPNVMEEVSSLVLNGVIPGDDIGKQLAALQNDPDRDYAAREYARLKPEYDRRLHERIRIEPGLKPYLFALLDKFETVEPSMRVGVVLNAIAARDDLKPADVMVVSQEVAKQLANPALDPHREGARPVYQYQFLTSAMSVLGRDLNAANQDLLLQALAWPHLANVNVTAADVLAKAGVAKAIPVMQATLERLAAKGDPYTSYIQRDLTELKENLAHESASSQAHPAALSPTFGSSPAASARPANTGASGWKDWLWLALGAAAILLVIGGMIFISRKEGPKDQ